LTDLLKQLIIPLIVFTLVSKPECSYALPNNTIEDSLKLPLHDTIRGQLLGKLAWLENFKDSKKAYGLADEELRIGKKYRSEYLILDAYKNQGLASILNKNSLLALNKYDSCIQFAQKVNNHFFLCKCYSLMGGMYSDRSEYEKSIDVYTKGLNHALKSKDERLISMVRNNLADMYMVSNYQIEKAEPLFLLALAANEKNKNWSSAAIASSNLADYYRIKSDQKSSDKYFDLAYNYIQRDTSRSFGYGTVYNALGDLIFKKKDYVRALDYGKRGLEVFDRMKYPVNALNSRIILAKSYTELQQYEKALNECKIITQKAKEEKSYIHLTEAYRIAANIAKKQGNYSQALDYLTLYDQWKDTLTELKKLEEFKNDAFKKIILERDLEVKYASQIKELENAELKLQNIDLKRKFIIGLCFILLLSILLYYLYVVVKEKNRINVELNKEKTLVKKQVQDKNLLIQEVHHRVKNNLTMINSLLYLQSKEIKSEETKEVLGDFQNRIRSIAIVHNKLYEESDISQIEFISFIRSIFNELLLSYSQLKKPIKLSIVGDSSPMEITSAVTIGLIFNELFTNSFKYAFDALEDGKIDIHVSEINKLVTIKYSDNGPGLQNDFELMSGNFGFKLLRLLPNQINGKLTYQNKDGRGEFQIICKLDA
jgi:two-component sensor histidine kinase